MSLRTIACTAALALCLPAAGQAQFSQYSPPGSFEKAPEDMKTRLRKAISEARWRNGRLYTSPWFGIHDLAYVDNVGQRAEGVPIDSDFTASLGLGLRSYLPVGSETVLAVHLLPEYVWFNELDERRRLNGRYGLGLFGDLGRTGLELVATREDNSRFFSREFEQRVNTTEERASASLQLDLGKGFLIFGSGALRRISFEPEARDPRLNILDRDEEVGRLGLRLRTERGLLLGLGVEDSDVEFEESGSARSNTGTSPYAELEFQGRRVSLGVDLVLRDLEPKTGPRRIAFDGTTGRAQLEWLATNFLTWELFGRSGLVYSFQGARAYFEDTSSGLGLRASLGSRASVRVFAETGENDYVAFEEATPKRVDDVETLGGELSVQLGRATFVLGGWQSDYESSLPEFDRTVKAVRLDVVFGSRVRSPWF